MLQVVGQVDRRHAALAQFTLDAVAAFEGCVEAGGGIWSVQRLTCTAIPHIASKWFSRDYMIDMPMLWPAVLASIALIFHELLHFKVF